MKTRTAADLAAAILTSRGLRLATSTEITSGKSFVTFLRLEEDEDRRPVDVIEAA